MILLGRTCSRSLWWGWRCRWGWWPARWGRGSSAASSQGSGPATRSCNWSGRDICHFVGAIFSSEFDTKKHANAGFHTPTKNIKMPQFLIFYTRLKKLTCGACDKYPVCLWKWVEDPDYITTRARLCKLCTQCVSGSIDFSTNSVIGEKPIHRALELRFVSAHLGGSVSKLNAKLNAKQWFKTNLHFPSVLQKCRSTRNVLHVHGGILTCLINFLSVYRSMGEFPPVPSHQRADVSSHQFAFSIANKLPKL